MDPPISYYNKGYNDVHMLGDTITSIVGPSFSYYNERYKVPHMGEDTITNIVGPPSPTTIVTFITAPKCGGHNIKRYRSYPLLL